MFSACTKGNNPENQNLAVWFCVRPGPTPFLAFGTPARFRVTGAASCGHYAAGAAGGGGTIRSGPHHSFATRASLRLAHHRRQAMAVRRLYEPLCIAFGTTVSSPTVPTYQLYDLPHKFTPRLYMESEDPNLVLREIGVWAGWEQAGSADTRSFLLDLLKDKDAHDNFLLREAGPTRFRRVRGIIVLTQKHLRIVQTKGSRLGGLRFQLTYQQACLVHGTKGARGPRERFVLLG